MQGLRFSTACDEERRAPTEPYTSDETYNEVWADAERLERMIEDAFDIGHDTEEVVRLLKGLKDESNIHSFVAALPKDSGRVILRTAGYSPVGVWKEIRENLVAICSSGRNISTVSLITAPGEPADSGMVQHKTSSQRLT